MKIELDMVLDARRKNSDWPYPVLTTEAVNEIGIDKLKQAIERHKEYLNSGENAGKHRRRKAKSDLNRILDMELRDYIAKRLMPEDVLESYVDEIVSGRRNPYDIIRQVINSFNGDKL